MVVLTDYRKITGWLSRFLPSTFFGLAIVLVFSASVYAVTQSYRTTDPALQPGMVAALSDQEGQQATDDDPFVQRASLSDAGKLIGISTTVEDSLVTVSKANRPVFVTSEGEVDAYVVDTNGPVNSGDLLQLSNIRGILERYEEGSGIIIGTALEDNDFSNAETYQASGDDSAQTVRGTKLRITINNRALVAAEEGDESTLAQLGFALTGKQIGEVRVLIALVIFLLVMIAEGGIIYGAISSAITSLGRNPLAKKYIRRELVRVLLIAIVVLGIGIAAIFAILFA